MREYASKMTRAAIVFALMTWALPMQSHWVLALPWTAVALFVIWVEISR